jgi:hypothetical protein
MKSEKKLNAKILELTMKIRFKNPELLKYLQEMPISIPNVTNPEINNKVLQEYYNSLKALLKGYNANRIDIKSFKFN